MQREARIEHGGCRNGVHRNTLVDNRVQCCNAFSLNRSSCIEIDKIFHMHITILSNRRYGNGGLRATAGRGCSYASVRTGYIGGLCPASTVVCRNRYPRVSHGVHSFRILNRVEELIGTVEVVGYRIDSKTWPVAVIAVGFRLTVVSVPSVCDEIELVVVFAPVHDMSRKEVRPRSDAAVISPVQPSN